VGEHRPAGAPLRAGGVDDHGDLGLGDGGGAGRLRAFRRRDRLRVLHPDELRGLGQPGADLPDLVLEVLFVEERLHPGVLQDGDHLAADEHVVQLDDGGAEVGRREEQLDELDGVVGQDPDAVAAGYPQGGERRGAVEDALVQLPVGHLVFFRGDGDPGRMDPRVVLEDVPDDHRPLRPSEAYGLKVPDRGGSFNPAW